ncbi:hypothetical protein QFZ32_004441 [Streptomyces canus]|uniref:Cytidine deaminase n=1 Tax=Streptomyces canus TaxID=58343 RepID=A0AAW8FFR5_9ACTN|nr:hypothetical protein [Streptomyces canus]MDQ1069001.1 hypothetical protein [Streptomyces canus]
MTRSMGRHGFSLAGVLLDKGGTVYGSVCRADEEPEALLGKRRSRGARRSLPRAASACSDGAR